MSRMKKYILICVLTLTCLFTISFLSFDRYLENKKEEIEEENREALAEKKSEPLDNSILITLFKDDTKEKSETLGKLKKELGVTDDVNQEKLAELLSAKGYSLDGIYDKEIVFKRSSKDSIEPNMYYIGESDGCIAIYTSDDEGNLTITDPTNDIFREGKKFKDLTKNDQQIIKNNGLKCKTKDEAEEKISELVS